jgi:hypothetical protein
MYRKQFVQMRLPPSLFNSATAQSERQKPQAIKRSPLETLKRRLLTLTTSFLLNYSHIEMLRFPPSLDWGERQTLKPLFPDELLSKDG